MGMLIGGKWTEDDQVIEQGRYVRPQSVFSNEIAPEIISTIRLEPGRFHLIGSNSCQWSHRTMILRELKGLDEVIPLHIAHGPRVEGYAANGGNAWAVPGADVEIVHLHQLYTLSDPQYTGRVTVPVLWDSVQGKIVSNESTQIMKAFDRVESNSDEPDFTLSSAHFGEDADTLIKQIYDGLNNGVYRAGFADSQDAYDEAIRDVFSTLDLLEERLTGRRYLLGSEISDADWRLFPTLLRFDAVFYVHHLCCFRRLVDYPNLWSYARDLYSWRGISKALSFETMRQASHAAEFDDEPSHIMAIAPDADWSAPHGRESIGPALIALRNGATVEVDTATLSIRH